MTLRAVLKASSVQQRGDLRVYSHCGEPPRVGGRRRKWGSPIWSLQLPRLQMADALLSPFLVSWLQLLGSIPQEDVVLFLGVVVLVALRRSDPDSRNKKKGKKQARAEANAEQAERLPPSTSRSWRRMQRCCRCD